MPLPSSSDATLVPLAGVVEMFADMTTRRFCKSLIALANKSVRIDHCSMMRISAEHGVQVFGSESVAFVAQAARAAVAYMDHYHRFEPNRALLSRWPEQSIAVRRHTANQIEHRGYRRVCYDACGLADRLSLVTRDESGALFAVNFYRQRESAEFNAGELAQLVGLSPLFSVASMRHMHLLLQTPASDVAWRARLKGACPTLSARELDVAAHMLAGHTLREIALSLDLAHSSVVTYRARAYARMGVSNLKELRAFFAEPPSP